MRWCLHVSLIVFIFALTACIPATPSTTSEVPNSSVTPGTPAATPECLIEKPRADGSWECVLRATPGASPTASCIVDGERIVAICKCVSPIFVEAWTDRNGNGNRDPEDVPLQGVRFRLQWLEDNEQPCKTPYWASLYLTTDATGHVLYELYGCGCGTEKIEPEIPTGHRLTSPGVGGCLFDAPASYGNATKFCRSYGFTPIAP